MHPCTANDISGGTPPIRRRSQDTLSGAPILESPHTTRKTSLRPARQEDYDFAAKLYLDSTRPLLTALGRWDEGRVVKRFGAAFKIDQVRVIQFDGADIGWMQ